MAHEFRGHLLNLVNLQPDSHLLDIGCGCGQIAGALVPLLRGRYEGIDPDAQAIGWCQRNITARHPRFQFRTIDFNNGYYNPQGLIDPATWTAPYDDATFDAVLLKSVFTHMLRSGVENYLAEIGRILRPGGRCLASAYILDVEAVRLMHEGATDFALRAEIDGGRAFDPVTPEYITGWYEETLRRAADAAGLRIVPPFHFGAWSGRRTPVLSYQDLIVFERRA